VLLQGYRGRLSFHEEMMMPTKASQRDQRIQSLKKMRGSDFAMEIASDFVVLPKAERAAAVRMLTALSETIDREAAAGQG
jgi:hypothetical protein